VADTREAVRGNSTVEKEALVQNAYSSGHARASLPSTGTTRMKEFVSGDEKFHSVPLTLSRGRRVPRAPQTGAVVARIHFIFISFNSCWK
jgi:hypothetical protein